MLFFKRCEGGGVDDLTVWDIDFHQSQNYF